MQIQAPSNGICEKQTYHRIGSMAKKLKERQIKIAELKVHIFNRGTNVGHLGNSKLTHCLGGICPPSWHAIRGPVVFELVRSLRKRPNWKETWIGRDEMSYNNEKQTCSGRCFRFRSAASCAFGQLTRSINFTTVVTSADLFSRSIDQMNILVINLSIFVPISCKMISRIVRISCVISTRWSLAEVWLMRTKTASPARSLFQRKLWQQSRKNPSESRHACH